MKASNAYIFSSTLAHQYRMQFFIFRGLYLPLYYKGLDGRLVPLLKINVS